MATSKFNYFLRNNVLLKNYQEISFNWWYVYFISLLEYPVMKFPVAMKQVTIILIKVKSCNALFCMLAACINIYLKSVLI